MAIAPAALGAPCGPGEYPCASGAFCDGVTNTCTAKRGAGESCADAADACGQGTYCQRDFVYSSTTAVCVPWVNVGADCGEWVGRCIPGAYCAASGRCAFEVPLRSACTVTDECLTGWCNAGTCTAPSDAGQPCTTSDGRSCVSGTSCDAPTQRCVAWDTCAP